MMERASFSKLNIGLKAQIFSMAANTFSFPRSDGSFHSFLENVQLSVFVQVKQASIRKQEVRLHRLPPGLSPKHPVHTAGRPSCLLSHTVLKRPVLARQEGAT